MSDVYSTGPRWTPKVKAQFAYALVKGTMTEAEAVRDTGASAEEIAEWVRRYRAHGYDGLKTTRTQTLR